MKVEYWSIDKIKPYARNARVIPQKAVDKVAASIQAFGFRVPLSVAPDGTILAGHTRLKAAMQLGLKEVPVEVAGELTKAQQKAYRLADNRTHQESSFDEALLSAELLDLKDEGIDLELTGFDEDEIDALLATGTDGLTDDDEAPPIASIAMTRPGDTWVLGAHRLYCGDATCLADVQALMAGKKADMLLTDPPYNVAYVGKTKDALTIQNDKMSDKNFREFLSSALTNADTVMERGAVFYIWFADVEAYNFTGACIDAGWQIRQCLVWSKNSLVLGRKDYHSKHELCLYGWKDGAAHIWNSDRKQVTVLECDRPTRSDIHPTMKPVELMEYQIRNNTNHKNSLVLDLFGGSGSTLIACEKAGRQCVMMELDPLYCDVIVKRWEEFTGKKATLENPERKKVAQNDQEEDTYQQAPSRSTPADDSRETA